MVQSVRNLSCFTISSDVTALTSPSAHRDGEGAFLQDARHLTLELVAAGCVTRHGVNAHALRVADVLHGVKVEEGIPGTRKLTLKLSWCQSGGAGLHSFNRSNPPSFISPFRFYKCGVPRPPEALLQLAANDF